jgi:ABC-type transport system involved in multi-copper enzyme maturation permease subunit
LERDLPFAQLCAANVILLVLAAQSIASEKETGTLEALLCTPLRNAKILNRKLSLLWKNFWGWYLLLNVPILLLLCHISGWFTAPVPRFSAWLLYLMGLPLAASTVGIFCSSYSKTSARAIVASIVAAAVLFQFCILSLFFFRNTSWWRSTWPALDLDNAVIGFIGVSLLLLAAGLYLILLKRFRQFAARI